MRKRGYASGFALSDLVMPGAIIMLVLCLVGYICNRNLQRAQEKRSRLIAEILECDPDEVPVATGFLKTRRAPARPSRGRLEAGVQARRSQKTVASAAAEPKEAPNPEARVGRRRPKRAARRATRRNRDVDVSVPGPSDVKPLARTQALADAYDRRCQAVMDDMR